MAITEWPKDERPRERLLKYGAAALSDASQLSGFVASTSSAFGANGALPFSVRQGVAHPLTVYAATTIANEAIDAATERGAELVARGRQAARDAGPVASGEGTVEELRPQTVGDRGVDLRRLTGGDS